MSDTTRAEAGDAAPASVKGVSNWLTDGSIVSESTPAVKPDIQRWLDYYAGRGWYIFPCKADKAPYTEHGFKDASTDPAVIAAWWAKWPTAAIGLDCGRSGVVVVDVDVKNGQPGMASWAALLAELGADLAETPRQTTPSGGLHALYAAPAGENVGNSAGKLGAGIDIKATGGYILLAPSSVKSGAYAWELGHNPTRPLTVLPAALAERLRPGLDSRFLGAAIWRHSSGDEDVIVVGFAGPGDGRNFFNVEGSGTALPGDELTPAPKASGGNGAGPIGDVAPAGGRAGDDYNQRGDHAELLTRHGAQLDHIDGAVEYWTRPGKDDGTSASWNFLPDRLKVFSSNWPGLEYEKTYSRFGLYAMLDHGGDFKAAAKALAGLGYGDKARPASSPKATTAPAQVADEVEGPDHLTDMGNSRRFARQHADKVRYTYDGLGWLVWTGQRWEIDRTGAAMRLAKKTARALFREAEDTASRAVGLIGKIETATAAGDTDQAEKLTAQKTKAERTAASVFKWALDSQGRSALNSMLALAQSELEIVARAEEFDRDPWLFNCANGTIDLRTGELRPHNRDDLLTKCSPVSYDPLAVSPTWERFLYDATGGNVELADFIQRAVGYTLWGQVFDKVVLLLLGPNDTGKTTFIEAILSALGPSDYGHMADMSLVLDRYNASGPRPDLVALRGRRLVALCEASEKNSIDSALLKRLSGGDRITTRGLYQEEMTFDPQHTVWLATNEVPKMNSDDHSLWERVKRLPFEHVVPEAKRDPKIKAALCDPLDGGPGVLAWAVKGCLEWQRRGLGAPDVVRRATAELRVSMDDIAPFFDACCVFAADAVTTANELRTVYNAWCTDAGISERNRIGGKAWGEALKKRGCESGRQRIDGKRISVWYGITFAAGDSDEKRT